MDYSRINTNPVFSPKINHDIFRWTLPPDYNEMYGLTNLGRLQNVLAEQKVNQFVINMGQVTWADPVPLLCMAILLSGANYKKEQMILNLGEIENIADNKDHLIFLKFFAKQGFLSSFSSVVNFQYQERGVLQTVSSHGDADSNALRLRLSHLPCASHYHNTDCIYAKIIPVAQYEHDYPSLQVKVDELLAEMKDRMDAAAIAREPDAREELYQKVKKILFELLLNIAEHAYPGKENKFAGVYARVRSSRPKRVQEAKAWCELFEKKTIALFGQGTFRPNHYDEWLELYVCDTGIGLTDQIEKWNAPEESTCATNLEIAQKSKNPFQSISNRIFRGDCNFSSQPREGRTAVTGLALLGNLLLSEDHLRMYEWEKKNPHKKSGGWVGEHHPWDVRNRYARKPADQMREPLTPVTGTVYAFSFQPGKETAACSEWCFTVDDAGRERVVAELRKRGSSPPGILWFDYCQENYCPIPDSKDLPKKKNHALIVLRPPSQVNKFDFANWQNLLVGNQSTTPETSCARFVMAGLSTYQLIIYHELLRHIEVHSDSEMDWILVSEKWEVCCLTTSKGKRIMDSSLERGRQFAEGKNGAFSLADLALLLREMDSRIFWNESANPGMDPFFNKPVVWHKTDTTDEDTENLVLPRYLDLPVALIDPERYHACLRALKRCLSLFPGYQPIPADNLVLSLVREAAMSQQINQDLPEILVGSVVVTGRTLNNLSCAGDQKVLHLFRHGEIDQAPKSSPLVALLWKTDLSGIQEGGQAPNLTGQTGERWQRITSTPYIAPAGEKSISVLRYRNNDDGSLDFNRPYYERTPEETYDDFKRLGILKIGHWYYGARHDLLTINMRLAFRFSFQEKGPLYHWLYKEFETFFKSPGAKAHILVYPSHPVTDTLFDRIRRTPDFKKIMPEGGMIPIKYVGSKTVSPLLASHLVRERINKIIHGFGWKRNQWSAVLFDDGTISGKHLRETTQLLQALGAKPVYLIVALERSGLPVQEEVIDYFFEKHRRFWRWDVPGLGSQGKCPLCQALSVVEMQLHSVSSSKIKERLKAWQDIWQARNVDMQWYQNQVTTEVTLDPKLEITFGVDPKRVDQDRKPIEKRLTFTNATAATSLLIELSRLTPRMDVAMKKAVYLQEKKNLDAAIEVLASQLLLFMDEMTKKELLERYETLLKWLWRSNQETVFTALGGLVFIIMDQDLIQPIWDLARRRLKEEVLKNYDIIFVASYLCNKHELLTGEEYFPNDDGIERQNYLFLEVNNANKLYESISVLLRIFLGTGNHPDQINAHVTDFKRELERIAGGGNGNTGYVIECLSQLLRILELLSSPNVFSLSDEDRDHLDVRSFDQRQADTIYTYLYENGLIERVRKDLFVFVNFIVTNNHKNLLFDSLVDLNRLESEWKEIVNDKINYFKSNKLSFDEILAWVEKEGSGEYVWNGKYPIIKKSTSEIQGERWLYFDKNFATAIRDILSNVLYAGYKKQFPRQDENESGEDDSVNDNHISKIKNPFKDSSTSIEEAHMWWSVEEEDDYIVFITANATDNREIKLRPQFSFGAIEKLKGKVKDPVVNDEGIAFTRLYIPKLVIFNR